MNPHQEPLRCGSLDADAGQYARVSLRTEESGGRLSVPRF